MPASQRASRPSPPSRPTVSQRTGLREPVGTFRGSRSRAPRRRPRRSRRVQPSPFVLMAIVLPQGLRTRQPQSHMLRWADPPDHRPRAWRPERFGGAQVRSRTPERSFTPEIAQCGAELARSYRVRADLFWAHAVARERQCVGRSSKRQEQRQRRGDVAVAEALLNCSHLLTLLSGRQIHPEGTEVATTSPRTRTATGRLGPRSRRGIPSPSAPERGSGSELCRAEPRSDRCTTTRSMSARAGGGKLKTNPPAFWLGARRVCPSLGSGVPREAATEGHIFAVDDATRDSFNARRSADSQSAARTATDRLDPTEAEAERPARPAQSHGPEPACPRCS